MDSNLNANDVVFVIKLLAVRYQLAQLTARFRLVVLVGGDVHRLLLDLRFEVFHFVLQLLYDDLWRGWKKGKFEEKNVTSLRIAWIIEFYMYRWCEICFQVIQANFCLFTKFWRQIKTLKKQNRCTGHEKNQ